MTIKCGDPPKPRPHVLWDRTHVVPNSETSLALLASCYGHLGRIDEARAAWAGAMKIAPNSSIERQRRILPHKNPEDFERHVEGSRKANISL